MSLPYESSTAGEKALLDLQKMLAKFGCASFGTGTDVERGLTIVSFKWRDRVVQLEASWQGYAAALMHHSGWRDKDRALAQARISVCSVLRDWGKAQITAIESGVMTFEEAFLPHMLLKDGRRVVEAARSANLLPAPQQ